MVPVTHWAVGAFPQRSSLIVVVVVMATVASVVSIIKLCLRISILFVLPLELRLPFLPKLALSGHFSVIGKLFQLPHQGYRTPGHYFGRTMQRRPHHKRRVGWALRVYHHIKLTVQISLFPGWRLES